MADCLLQSLTALNTQHSMYSVITAKAFFALFHYVLKNTVFVHFQHKEDVFACTDAALFFPDLAVAVQLSKVFL